MPESGVRGRSSAWKTTCSCWKTPFLDGRVQHGAVHRGGHGSEAGPGHGARPRPLNKDFRGKGLVRALVLLAVDRPYGLQRPGLVVDVRYDLHHRQLGLDPHGMLQSPINFLGDPRWPGFPSSWPTRGGGSPSSALVCWRACRRFRLPSMRPRPSTGRRGGKSSDASRGPS